MKPAQWRTPAFVVLMLGLTAVFLALGLWQWQRLGEKEALIAAIAERTGAAPIALPPVAEWPIDGSAWAYMPVTVTGRFLPGATVLVFTSLADARGERSGPGYWVMTPLALDGGGTVFVNRGFVPQDDRPAFAHGGAVPTGTTTLTGLAREAETTGAFTPNPDRINRIDWVRDPARLARFSDTLPAPLADITIDLPAGPEGALPQGGETVVEFPNNHFGYALTWFGFALLTPILLVAWLRGGRRPDAA